MTILILNIFNKKGEPREVSLNITRWLTEHGICDRNREGPPESKVRVNLSQGLKERPEPPLSLSLLLDPKTVPLPTTPSHPTGTSTLTVLLGGVGSGWRSHSVFYPNLVWRPRITLTFSCPVLRMVDGSNCRQRSGYWSLSESPWRYYRTGLSSYSYLLQLGSGDEGWQSSYVFCTKYMGLQGHPFFSVSCRLVFSDSRDLSLSNEMFSLYLSQK